jgi:predicted kinase
MGVADDGGGVGREQLVAVVESGWICLLLDGRASTAVGEWVIARLILVNGPPASGKSTLARRFVDDHDRSALVEFDAMRMSLPNWEGDEATRLVARELAGAATAEHLTAGRDVVMPQYFGRLGFIVVLEGIAREHEANFVEVILSIDPSLAIDRFRARRRAMAERGERHPEREIADPDVEAFIVDAVDRLTRLPTARPDSRIVPVEFGASEDDVYRRLLTVLDEGAEAPCGSRQ